MTLLGPERTAVNLNSMFKVSKNIIPNTKNAAGCAEPLVMEEKKQNCGQAQIW